MSAFTHPALASPLFRVAEVLEVAPRERSNALSFRAPSIEAAREYAIADLRASLEHITAQPDDE